MADVARPGSRFIMLARGAGRGYVAALGLVAVVSALIGGVSILAPIANLSTLYLLAVLAAAICYGRGPAIVSAFAAFLTFNWFFVEPVHTFVVHRPEEVLALVVLLFAAVVTGQLAARERARRRDAEARERDAILLGALATALSEGDLDLGRHLRIVAERLRRDLHLAMVRIERDEGSLVAVGDGTSMGPTWECALTLAGSEGRRGGRLVVGRFGDTPPFNTHDERVLAAVAAQLGTAIERARLRREATEAETLRRADELKTALLNAVSHDLRTPLAAIIASAASLRLGEIDWTDEERGDFARTIEEEAIRLNRLVGNLLDLSRIESGSLRPRRDWYDLDSLIEDVVARLRPRLPDHSLAVTVAPDLPPVYLDWVAIDQVLSNLIENAAKYSPPGTKVWIAARCVGGEAEIQVADRGPGIPRESLPHLFTPFFRVRRVGRSPDPAGSGLGLTVARGLVEAHGGRIGVLNRRDGGAIFTIILPGAAPATADETIAGPLRERPA